MTSMGTKKIAQLHTPFYYDPWYVPYHIPVQVPLDRGYTYWLPLCSIPSCMHTHTILRVPRRSNHPSSTKIQEAGLERSKISVYRKILTYKLRTRQNIIRFGTCTASIQVATIKSHHAACSLCRKASVSRECCSQPGFFS